MSDKTTRWERDAQAARWLVEVDTLHIGYWVAVFSYRWRWLAARRARRFSRSYLCPARIRRVVESRPQEIA